MSRKVYLIRHAMPDIPIGERWCVGGRTDLPLGRLGRLQAALLPFVPELRDLGAVFCSGMIRARQTALPLCPVPREMPGLQEQDMGVWDGLSFREIGDVLGQSENWARVTFYRGKEKLKGKVRDDEE